MSRRALAVLALLLPLPRGALADADELSLQVQLPFGRVSISDPDLEGRSFTATQVGLGARVTYALSNRWAYEAHASWNRLTQTIDGDIYLPEQAHLWRSVGWLRIETGITARLGVQVVPTLHASVGMQTRISKTWTQERWQRFEGYDYSMEPMISLGAGLDYRMDARWAFGFLALHRQILTADTPTESHWAGLVHASYYLYPMQD